MDITDTPQLVLAPLSEYDLITAGMIYMQNSQKQGQLPDGVKAVLITTDGQRLELLSRRDLKPGAQPNTEGTYINKVDLAKIAARHDAKLRRYGFWKDTVPKLASGPGVVTLLLALAAFATPVAALVLLLLQPTEPTVATTADKAQAVLEWARQPADTLPNSPTADQMAGARHELDRRIQQASWCLQTLQGHQAPATPSIPGITCESPQPALWQNPNAAPLVAAILAVITAVLGLVKLQGSFGFQKTPTT
jgi:hypothetical protein